MGHPDYILLFTCDYDPENPKKQLAGKLNFRSEHYNLVDATGGASRATNYTADPKSLSLRVLDCPKDKIVEIETPRIFNIELLFSSEDDAVKTKAFLED